MNPSEKSYIYTLTNEFMHHMDGHQKIGEMIKIGFTNDHPRKRAINLGGNTGVPGKFEMLKFWEVSNGAAIEKRIFKEISQRRTAGEFYSFETKLDCINEIERLLQSWGEINESGISVTEQERRQDRIKNEKIEKQNNEEQYKLRLKKALEIWPNERRNITHKTNAYLEEWMKNSRGSERSELIIRIILGVLFFPTIVAPYMAFSYTQAYLERWGEAELKKRKIDQTRYIFEGYKEDFLESNGLNKNDKGKFI